MGRRSKQEPRCPVCRLHLAHCLCDELRPVLTRTHVAVVMHRREEKKSTNTGRLALLTLANSSLHVRGHADAPADLSVLEDPSRRTLLLFPREDAVVLDARWVQADPRPPTLIVPDGTWSQARRMVRREPVLARAQAVLAPPGPPARYCLRRETADDGLATAEAIARALAVLEGVDVAEELDRIFEMMVSRTLATRRQR